MAASIVGNPAVGLVQRWWLSAVVDGLAALLIVRVMRAAQARQ